MSPQEIAQIQKQLTASQSLNEAEKEVLYLLLPLMKEEDAQKIKNALDYETELLSKLPLINQALEEQIDLMFDQIFIGFNTYKKNVIQDEEKKLNDADLNQAEDLLKNI